MGRHSIRRLSLGLGLAFCLCGDPAAGATFQFRESSIQSYSVEFSPSVNSDSSALWLDGRESGTLSRRVRLSHRLVIQLAPGAELSPILDTHGLSLERVVANDLFICAADDALSAALTAESLKDFVGLVACYPIMRKEIELDSAYARRPNDYYFKFQAYHEFRDGDGSPVGADVNTRAAWPYTMGEGIIIAVADTGIQGEHPELANQLSQFGQHNFASDADDGTVTGLNVGWAHGISVAGLAVAEGNNNVGMVGVAPGAKLASWVIFDENLMRVGEDKLLDMYTHLIGVIPIQNHSWGGGDIENLVMPGPLELAGIQFAIENGRQTRGTIMVRSGGNRRLTGGNANDSFYPSDPRVIGVAAVEPFGRVANYSNPGASLLISAPGGQNGSSAPMFTTDLLEGDGATNFRIWIFGDKDNTQDLWNYRFDYNQFVGTSAAAPIVSGICALMLSVNPDLNYRDVQFVLTLAARHVDLDDPAVQTNGAGFTVSHNQGFGVVDAGTAVTLAKGWVNQMDAVSITNTITTTEAIPDDGYRLIISGTGVPASLNYITNRNSVGPIADNGTAAMPIVDVGLANDPIAIDLTGKVALVERGGSDFDVKINHAADAGAEFVVIYNDLEGSLGCPGGDELCPMGGTDFTTVPAVFIGNTQGTAIKTLLNQQSDTLAMLSMAKTAIEFPVTSTLVLEHVGVRLKTDHALRGDLRITLVSPSGVRSILQRFGPDTDPGPTDWTYYSTLHHYESSAGTWRVELSDHAEGFTGNLLEASLILNGVQILDTDGDGLDDDWEDGHFATLAMGPRDDPDEDGYQNAREQIMRTDPNVAQIPFMLDSVAWNSDLIRLSWPGVDGVTYEMLSGPDVSHLNSATNIAGTFPETVWFTTYTNLQQNFFLLRQPE